MTDETLAAVAEDFWQWRLQRDTYLQLRTGAKVERLPSQSLREAEEDAAQAGKFLGRLDEIDPAGLAGDDPVTHAALAHSLRELVHGPTSWWWSFPVTPYQFYWGGMLVQRLFVPFRFAGAGDAERYLSLARDLAGGFAAAREKLGLMAERGWRIPRPAQPGARAAITGIRGMVAAALPVASERLEAVPDAGSFAERLERLLADEVLPSLDTLGESVGVEYEQQAGDAVGLGHLPGGEEAYRGLVRQYLTFDVDPEELHRTGLEEVERLTGEMRALHQGQGFTGTEEEYRAVLEQDPRFRADAPEDVEAAYRRHIGAIEPVLGKAFSVLPAAPYDVERLDPGMEAGMSYGHYEPPTPDRPVGRYRYNGSGLDTRAQLNAAALIYHELVPGHHFHLARQSENEALPAFRRQNRLGVFNEGWAEYAADLARDMGMYADPWDAYGLMVHQRFTSQRLIVDTGLNALGWSLDKARETMARYTMESPTQVATETLRYSTDLPAQALSYRFGCLTLIEFRERARAALGDRFDLRDFHEAVLGQGALPLDVLEGHLDRWAAAR